MDVLPSPVVALCQAFLDGLPHALGDNLCGVYLYGALAFPDSRDSVQDVDYHVILEAPLEDPARRAVDELRRRLAADFSPLGEELDGYFITLDDARRTAPPPTQMWPLWRTPVDAAWALHCAHIRAGRCVVLSGPDPLDVYPVPSWPEIEAALYGEIRYVDHHLEDAAAYCVLNACRLMYSFETRDVVTSKRAAATWAIGTLSPRWQAPVAAALRVYGGQDDGEDRSVLERDVRSFVAAAWNRIARIRAAGVLPE